MSAIRVPFPRSLQTLLLIALCTAAPAAAANEAPCDSTDPREPDVEQPVQIGVRSEMRGDTCLYVYTILNRSRDTLTTVFVGWNSARDECELTGASPHAPPDTAYSPEGWESAPFQHDDPMKFSVGWSLVDTLTGGIPPDTLISGFTVALPHADPMYESLNWMIRMRGPLQYCAAHCGTTRPESELDVRVEGTGTISGRVLDEGGVPVAYPGIFAKRGVQGVESEADGRYVIRAVPAGKARLVARTRGYRPCEKSGIRVHPGETTRVDFRLASWPSHEVASGGAAGADVEVGRSEGRGKRSASCVPYRTATDRLMIPFPGDAVDTVGAVYLERSMPVPSRVPGSASKPQAFVYGVSGGLLSFAYQGLAQDTVGRAFTATVHRNFRTSEEEALIRIAEETYPPAEAVLAVGEKRAGSDAPKEQERLWWYGDFDGVRLPYAVTLDAVRYYLGMVQAMGRNDSTRTPRIKMKRAEFTYSASISPASTLSRDGRVFRDVYVVEMRLSWSNYCGSLCACSFKLDRTVVLRRDGTVLCVFGDRKPSVLVS